MYLCLLAFHVEELAFTSEKDCFLRKIPANSKFAGIFEGCPVGLEPTTFRTTI